MSYILTGSTQSFKQQHHVKRYYTSPKELFKQESFDIADIIVNDSAHFELVLLAATFKTPFIICQKPFASTLQEAVTMIDACKNANSLFFIHENWRFQHSIRLLKTHMESQNFGEAITAIISHCHGRNSFIHQPYLKDLEKFTLMNMGSHVLDVARFLFGDAINLSCSTKTINQDIKGEDEAIVTLNMENCKNVTAKMASNQNHPKENFLHTYIKIEYESGFIELRKDEGSHNDILITNNNGHLKKKIITLPNHIELCKGFKIAEIGMINCLDNILTAISNKNERLAETRAEDNLKTFKLVHFAYESTKITGQQWRYSLG